MKKFIVAALLTALPVTALDAMTVATFLAKAEALERRGALALLSRDLRLLRAEIQNAGRAARAEQAAAQRQGRRPPFCLPEEANAAPAELLAAFRTIPARERQGMEVREGFRRFVARKYPCR